MKFDKKVSELIKINTEPKTELEKNQFQNKAIMMMGNMLTIFKNITAGVIIMIIAGCSSSEFTSHPNPISIIYDTDIGTDVDDAGALAILHIMADKGEANILATISANQNPFSAPAIDVINTYYGRPDLPIGSSKTGPDPEQWYHKITPNYPHDLKSGNDAP